MAFRKAANQEFQQQFKDIRGQLLDQLKCLEGRTDSQINIYHEINDFCKKRAEIDQEYSKQLDKLVKSVYVKFKNEKNVKKNNWAIYSPWDLFEKLVDDSKEEAKNRAVVSDVLGTFATQSINTRCAQMTKISKKCREIGNLAQGEIVRVLNELNTSMKSYFEFYEEAQAVHAKLLQAEEKNKANEGGRKQKTFQKAVTKKSEKYDAAKLKCNKARNEYLLCVDAANAALHKFFADDLSDLIDCTDVGTDYWLSLLLDNIINSRKAACHAEMQQLAKLNEFRQSIAECEQQKCDKQRFFQSQSNTFMLPKTFEFKTEASESVNRITMEDGICEDLTKRHNQIRIRLESLREESEQTSQQLFQTQERIRELLSQQQALEITEKGIIDHRPPVESVEAELDAALDEYTTAFSFFLLNANLIVRLEARADGIERAVETFDPKSNTHVQLPAREPSDQITEWHERERRKPRFVANSSTPNLMPLSMLPVNSPDHRPSICSMNSQPMNSTSTLTDQNSPLSVQTPPTPPEGHSAALSPPGQRRCSHQHQPQQRRPRLFGGALDEYVQLTGEQIPLVVTSCVSALAQHALHHQGLFRVNASLADINRIKDAFEEGEDPLTNVRNASDINSIAGVLKLYFRKLREPVFPFFMFELITDCAKITNIDEFINKITDLINKLPPSSYILLRYLFSFLHHVSRYSDENMMDAYNLAVCFGPCLLKIPENKDQVYYQNYVNDVVKNLISFPERIFSNKVPGPLYNPIRGGYGINDEVNRYVDDTDDLYMRGTTTPSTTDTIGTMSTLNEQSAFNMNPIKFSLTDPPSTSTAVPTENNNFSYSSSENSMTGTATNTRKSICVVDEAKTSVDLSRRLSLIVGQGNPISDGTVVGIHHQPRTVFQTKNQLNVELNNKDDDSGTGGCSPAGKSAESQDDNYVQPQLQTRPSIDSGIGPAHFSNGHLQQNNMNSLQRSTLNKNRTLDRIRIPVPSKPVAPPSSMPSSVNSTSSPTERQATPPSYHQLYSSINKRQPFQPTPFSQSSVSATVTRLEGLCDPPRGNHSLSSLNSAFFSSSNDSILDSAKPRPLAKPAVQI